MRISLGSKPRAPSLTRQFCGHTNTVSPPCSSTFPPAIFFFPRCLLFPSFTLFYFIFYLRAAQFGHTFHRRNLLQPVNVFRRRHCTRILNARVANSLGAVRAKDSEGSEKCRTRKEAATRQRKRKKYIYIYIHIKRKKQAKNEKERKVEERNSRKDGGRERGGARGEGPSARREDFNRLVHVVFPRRGNLRAP